LDDQTVAPVLDVRDHAPNGRGERILGIVLVGLIARPVAALRVEQEAHLLLLGAALPAEVDALERRGVAVGERGERASLPFHGGAQRARAAPVLCEAHAAPDLEAEA